MSADKWVALGLIGLVLTGIVTACVQARRNDREVTR